MIPLATKHADVPIHNVVHNGVFLVREFPQRPSDLLNDSPLMLSRVSKHDAIEPRHVKSLVCKLRCQYTPGFTTSESGEDFLALCFGAEFRSKNFTMLSHFRSNVTKMLN